MVDKDSFSGQQISACLKSGERLDQGLRLCYQIHGLQFYLNSNNEVA